ncbi:carbohydrate ABC transporter permease [Ferviditalea candida]|uniref:Carbohydrate ABC transporter permease n=1 Tax=Ferviditalea candida TaxID=3108399 RepID=A0ABU5ZLS6_9BACL|nr:carbohydrate ABC transporter permease [Paenibacillaceae bacterium T2]
MYIEGRLPRMILLSFLLVVLIFMIFPFFIMILTALRPLSEIFRFPPTWFPQTWRWQNFVDIWTHVPMSRYMLNSLIVGIGATLLNLVVSIPAAYALARMQFAGQSIFRNIILYTQMFSPIVLIIGLFKTMASLNMLNTYQSLILTYAALGIAFSIWFLTSFFKAIPIEIEEASLIDGCSKLGVLFRIVLPMSLPGLVATTIFAFIWAWNDFMIALTFMSKPEMQTLPLGIYSFVGQYMVQWHYLMAAAILTTIPVLVLFLYIEKYLVQGLTSGGIK